MPAARPGSQEVADLCPTLKPPRTPGELHDAETLEEVLEGEILAERDEMDLVVAADDAALVVDDEQAVIDAGSG